MMIICFDDIMIHFCIISAFFEGGRGGGNLIGGIWPLLLTGNILWAGEKMDLQFGVCNNLLFVVF